MRSRFDWIAFVLAISATVFVAEFFDPGGSVFKLIFAETAWRSFGAREAAAASAVFGYALPLAVLFPVIRLSGIARALPDPSPLMTATLAAFAVHLAVVVAWVGAAGTTHIDPIEEGFARLVLLFAVLVIKPGAAVACGLILGITINAARRARTPLFAMPTRLQVSDIAVASLLGTVLPALAFVTLLIGPSAPYTRYTAVLDRFAALCESKEATILKFAQKPKTLFVHPDLAPSYEQISNGVYAASGDGMFANDLETAGATRVETMADYGGDSQPWVRPPGTPIANVTVTSTAKYWVTQRRIQSDEDARLGIELREVVVEEHASRAKLAVLRYAVIEDQRRICSPLSGSTLSVRDFVLAALALSRPLPGFDTKQPTIE